MNVKLTVSNLSRYFCLFMNRQKCHWDVTGGKTTPYTQPPWCERLCVTVNEKIQLAQLPTPIHAWSLPGVPKGFDVFIKRDDMTGCTLSGNKVRKLEFLLADALCQGCSHVITCGGIQSNHCRATTVAATQLGLKSHLVLRSDLESPDEAVCHGNLFFDRICGADLYYVGRKTSYETELKPRMEQIAQKIKYADTGQSSYLIPVGGSNAVGLHGYLSGFQEMMDQGVLDRVTDVVFACGSRGTAEGLALGNYLGGDSKLGIHGIAVCDNADYFHSHTDHILQEVGLMSVRSRDILDVVEGYKGEGYGLTTQEELDFLVEVSRTTGIILDPTYTGKAARGLVLELQRNPGRFKENKILFLHTGGVFGAMDDTLDTTLRQSSQLPQNNTYVWKDLSVDPW